MMFEIVEKAKNRLAQGLGCKNCPKFPTKKIPVKLVSKQHCKTFYGHGESKFPLLARHVFCYQRIISFRRIWPHLWLFRSGRRSYNLEELKDTKQTVQITTELQLSTFVPKGCRDTAKALVAAYGSLICVRRLLKEHASD